MFLTRCRNVSSSSDSSEEGLEPCLPLRSAVVTPRDVDILSGPSSNDLESYSTPQQRTLSALLREMAPNILSKNIPVTVESVNREDPFIIDTGFHDPDMNALTIDNNTNAATSIVKTKRKKNRRHASTILSSSLDSGIDLSDIFLNFDLSGLKMSVPSSVDKDDTEVMTKSVITPGFLKKDVVGSYSASRRRVKNERKLEHEKTASEDWFHIPATELTEERRRDLELLQIRDTLDPKRHYKSNDRKVLPKYFQVGTVLDNPADFYHSRVPKSQRKNTMLEEILADEQIKERQKRQYNEIQQMVTSSKKGAFQSRKKKQKQ